MSATLLQFEHFYYGQPAADYQAPQRTGLLAASAGITPELAAATVERVTLPLPPFTANHRAWALVRGSRQQPFVMVQVQRSASGQSVAHYSLLPSDLLRTVGGNLRELLKLLDTELPAFGDGVKSLPLLSITPPQPESDDQQTEDILDLMSVVNNRVEVMESLLAAIVRNVPIVVVNAPEEFKARVDFMAGLLALLPFSVRYAVTFATYSTDANDVD
ncbi:MAG: hypothetical protein H7Y11_00095, partial [Armatimonadetes bacterium]|nr:hypothetical protein [Anaerolineae bacterium]